VGAGGVGGGARGAVQLLDVPPQVEDLPAGQRGGHGGTLAPGGDR